MPSMETGQTSATLTFLVVIAHYNHLGTLRQVAQKCRAVWPHVLVVDDGSDTSPNQLLEDLDVELLCQTPNQGKGTAILAGAAWARAHGFTHIITIDADDQHEPAEIPLFVQASSAQPQAIVLGVRRFDENVPFGSRFGRKFGNFWVHVQTGKEIRDIQSGYRCYPVNVLDVLNVWSKRYAFEVEVIVRALWAGFDVQQIDVSVRYTKERISHFSQWKDNLRLTLLNTYLTMRSMLPIAHTQYQLVVNWQVLGDFILDKRPANGSSSVAIGNKIFNGISLQQVPCRISEGTAKRHSCLHALGNIHRPWESEFDRIPSIILVLAFNDILCLIRSHFNFHARLKVVDGWIYESNQDPKPRDNCTACGI